MNNRQPGRRGRGRNTNNRPQSNRGGGGSDRDNRIDNRTRGNAVQMLDKFKKMAQDAQVNGDRVQAEYYHQFADHYFRVNADTMARREEQRVAREEPRGDNRSDNRGNSNGHDDDSDYDDDAPRGRSQQSQPGRQKRDDRNDHDDRDDQNNGDTVEAAEEKKPVRSRRPRKADNGAARDDSAEKNGGSNGLDASALPPAISKSAEVEVEKKPARKKRVMKPRATEESDAA
ncbi:DUF4167 domain-containing protein [Parasphingorhabdus sp.]|uniref:DUF4167 domain-containing protein n=1 Tax=Parasphingorhabdus sp. TaxID=2709688 RepID=UPI003002511B